MSSRAHTSSANEYSEEVNSGYLRLEHARSPYCIELSAALIPQLLAAIAEGAQHRTEVGGLLTGSFPKAATLTLRIEDFIPIDRRTGDDRKYNLTPEQRARLSTTRHKLIQQQTPVLGFFRSHLRAERLELSSEDRDLLATEFRRAVHVALLVEAEAPHAAAFLVPGPDGALQTGPPIPELQFSAGEIARFFPRSLRRSENGAVPAREAEIGSGSAREPETATRASSPRQMLWTYGSIAFAVLFLCLSLTAWAPATARLFSGQKTLGMEITPSANMLELRWNQNQSDLTRAGAATLTVRDGGDEQRILLSPRQIQFGAVSYQPRTAHVEFSLAVPLPGSTELIQRVEWTRR